MKRILFLVVLLSLGSVNLVWAQSCNCKEYIYINEPSGIVHKMEVTPGTGALTEVGGVNGIPWLNNPTEFPSPHGLGVDRNGFLYIGSNFTDPNDIRKLDCLGNLFSETEYRIPPEGTGNWGFLLTNINSFDGFIYANGPNFNLYKIDPCTGTIIGYVQLVDDGNFRDWGFYIDENGKFYATQPSGKIYAFTPSASDFTSNTTYQPIVDLGANPSFGGLSPAYAGDGLQGIVTDNSGNIYVIEGNRDVNGTSSRLLKFSSTGTFLAAGAIDSDGNDNAGWNQMTGITFSKNSNKLYTTSLNPNEDCIYRWNTDLTADGGAVGPVPNAFGQCKAIAILSECCPESETIEKTVCGVMPGDRVSLSELLTCDGIVCQGQWQPVQQDANLVFNDCDLTATVNGTPACGTYQISNTGLTGTTCPNYTITVNVKFLAGIDAQVIAGNQTVCPTDDPAEFTVTTAAFSTPAGETITYQWQKSTTSATAGFTNIIGANNATYDSGPVSQTTYFRVIASISGCTDGSCNDISNVVTLTLNSNCPPPCPAPTPIGVAAERCGAGTVTLTATGCTAAYPAIWYTNSGLTTAAPGTNTGNSYTTPSISTTTTYYVACVETADPTCKSAGVAVAATIKPNPTITAATPVCNEGGTAFEVAYTAMNGSTVTADRGTADLPNTKFTDITSGETITITAELNGCEATTTATATCTPPCLYPNCGGVTVIKN